MSLADLMAGQNLVVWAELGLIVSLATFVGIVLYVLAAPRQRAWEQARRLPLAADEGRDE